PGRPHGSDAEAAAGQLARSAGVRGGDRQGARLMRLRLTIGSLALVGVGVSAYLTATHFADAAPVCTSGGCEIVQRSQWATLGPAPVALLGLLAFLAVLGSA